jgi:hypothetical protein
LLLVAQGSPPAFVKASKEIVSGNPEKEFISTSMVERSNLSLRMGNRRITRLTRFQRKPGLLTSCGAWKISW